MTQQFQGVKLLSNIPVHPIFLSMSGVSNHWTGMVEWTMEWMIELLCTADETIFQYTQASLIPFPMSDLRRVSRE